MRDIKATALGIVLAILATSCGADNSSPLEVATGTESSTADEPQLSRTGPVICKEIDEFLDALVSGRGYDPPERVRELLDLPVDSEVPFTDQRWLEAARQVDIETTDQCGVPLVRSNMFAALTCRGPSPDGWDCADLRNSQVLPSLEEMISQLPSDEPVESNFEDISASLNGQSPLEAEG